MTSEGLDRLGPHHLRSAVTTYRDVLRAHQERVNRLNVYPVPDGDTGTNMALTLESVVSALEDAGDMAGVCAAIARGSLMGARGNSGVILSQLLRGVSEVLRGAPGVGGEELAGALRAGSRAADSAVSRPVEGTMLTVARAAAEGAEEAAAVGKGLVEVLDTARARAAEALERTPELLPVLKQAGVVDAGGLGLLLFLDALAHVAAGRPLPEPEPVPAGAGIGTSVAGPSPPESPAADGLRYEVMFLLEAPDESIPAFKDAWALLGDSVVVAGGDGLWSCHIHTGDIGKAIEEALEWGRPRDIRVTDLDDQVEQERCAREAADHDDDSTAGTAATAVVAVAAGEGITQMFRSLGVQRVVTGGQSMNPSAADIVRAVDAVSAEEVVVLPNNKNVVPVADQAGDLTAKTVRVVPTHAVGEGLAALLEYDPTSSADGNAKAMAEAARRVACGEVTRAVRASHSEAGPVREGDWLGTSGGAVRVVGQSLEEAAIGLLERLLSDDTEIVTVLEGDGASEAGTSRLRAWLAEHRPEVDVEVHRGGQPLYPYLVSAE